MITLKTFYETCKAATGRVPNDEQKEALEALPSDPLFIVAGPGTGKTACLTLRILKLVFVDGLPPQGILATTFTKKAAAELRSRILSWGFGMIEVLQKDDSLREEVRESVASLDINQVLTGTIDSICEQLLRDHRESGTMPPVLADEFVSKTLLLREGMFKDSRHRDENLDGFLLDIHGGSRYGFHVGRKTDLTQNFWDRQFHDQVDWESFLRDGDEQQKAGSNVLTSAFGSYRNALNERNLVDFSLLEQEVLCRLRDGKLQEFRQQLKAVLVDEYQDTNLLQEAIYFELAKSCGGALAVVGDDDQSLYRFRGATVELFSNFISRYEDVFGKKPFPVFLKTNYRSSQAIIRFVNQYATLDDGYQEARVADKPKLKCGPKADEGFPVLGMFRSSLEELANDLSDFIHQTFRNGGYTLPDGQIIKATDEEGDVGDCALLCSSPAEYNSSGNPRLPWHLRNLLQEKSPSIPVFNPRGQDLTDVEIVRIFGGLLLECLDPSGEVEDDIWLLDETRHIFRDWRDAAIEYLENRSTPKGLADYAIGWASRNPGRAGYLWPKSVPVLELIYGLTHFFPRLYDDPEGQVYLEVFTRQVTACEEVGKFSARVVTDTENDGLSKASVKELINDFLSPIAAGSIKVNEDLMEAFPRNRLSILSIHQSKGLEFPMTIVDVGSDFKGNHRAHAFKRFPSGGGTPHKLEDVLRKHTGLGTPTRSPLDRAFDDLYRQFFVAYSRPQEILLLVGLTKSIPNFSVYNVATGWTRNAVCKWQARLPLQMI